MKGSTVRRALAGALLVATVAGCGSASPGDAAVVDGTSIKIDDLNLATRQISAWNGEPVDAQTVLYYLVTAPKAVDAASQAGVGVSLEDARAALQTKVADPSPAAVEMLQGYGAGERIRRLPETEAKQVLDQLAADLKASDIKLNPRYGSFDAQNVKVVAPIENWLYQSAAAGTPAVTPTPTP